MNENRFINKVKIDKQGSINFKNMVHDKSLFSLSNNNNSENTNSNITNNNLNN
jgi:hypothetical protein